MGKRKQVEKQRELMGRGDEFDPDAARFRALRGEEDAESRSAPEIPSSGVSHFTSFRVNAGVSEVISRLGQAMSKIAAKYTINEDTFKVKASVVTPVGPVSATAQIFSAGTAGIHVVDLRRRRGNTLKFQQLFNS